MHLVEARRKIIQKNGNSAVFVKLSVIAKVLGFSSSEPVADAADRAGIEIVRLRKYRAIHKSDLDRLLEEIIQRA